MQRLSKILSKRGIASRRECEKIIEAKRVKVNGTIALKPQTLVDIDKDVILLDNKPIPLEEEKVYFILNKPKGYLCTNAKNIDKKKVIDLFKKIPFRLFTVGRLDKDTTGLIIVTNDGFLANKIIHPSANIEKEYLVKTKETISHNHLVEISKRTKVEGQWIKPLSVKKVRRNTLKIIIKEGKKHEVRILVKNAGLKIIQLTRIRIGNLSLGKLPEGTFKQISAKKVQNIYQK